MKQCKIGDLVICSGVPPVIKYKDRSNPRYGDYDRFINDKLFLGRILRIDGVQKVNMGNEKYDPYYSFGDTFCYVHHAADFTLLDHAF